MAFRFASRDCLYLKKLLVHSRDFSCENKFTCTSFGGYGKIGLYIRIIFYNMDIRMNFPE